MTNLKNKGAIVTLVLVFGTIFLILLGGVLTFILMQSRQVAKKVAWNEALYIAEAGINYYQWCLNNEVEGSCDTEKDYYDVYGTLLGGFSIETEFETSCGEVVKRKITASGWTNEFPETKREVGALYGKTSVARFAYLLNDNVWAGADREIRGIYHSNKGVRMDGENQSLVSSHAPEWVCTSSFGCSPCPTGDGCWIDGTDCMCPGVFTTTANANTDLFDFPVSPFDFDGITVDLARIKGIAQSSGLYLPLSTDINVLADGYHIKFLNNGTIEVWIITRLWSTWAYNIEEGWHNDYFSIRDEYLYNTYTLNPECLAIFVEDDLWVEGEVKGKITVVSADLISSTRDTDVILVGDIDYTVKDGTDALAVIAEKDVLISPDSPDQMELRGIFIAQKGHFGINHYPWNIKDQLEMYGSVVSNGRVGTRWTSGSSIVSGYNKRENYIDSHLIYSPPPFVPSVSIEFNIIDWEEIE